MPPERLTLADAPFVGRTGHGVRVAVVDSGIAPNHPHVGGLVSTGVSLIGAGDDTADRLGHGTAVAAVIREKAPDAELVPIRIFDRELATDAATLARAIDWALENGCRIVNLSLGTANAAHAGLLQGALERAARHDATVISAFESDGVRWLPGSQGLALGVVAAPELDRDTIEFEAVAGEGVRVRASIYPRPIPGVPKERNLHGVSFAVANVSGFMARLAEGTSGPIALPVTF